MNKRPLFFLAILIVVAAGFSVVQAQQNSPAENSKAAVEKQKAKAVDLLKSLAGQTSTLRSTENRARLQSNIAGSIWEHDEKLARSLFSAVEDEIKAGLVKAQSREVEDEKARMVFVHLRMDTIKRIGKYDPKLALEFMKSTESASNTRASYAYGELERSLEVDLARAAAANMPELALTMGRRELERGYSPELLSLLSKLLRKHRTEGAVLYHETVGALRDSDMSNGETPNFAINLARSISPSAVDDADFRELINVIIGLASSRGCARMDEADPQSWFCDRIGTVVPQIERVDPPRAAELRRWYKGPESVWPREGYEELEEATLSGSVDDILALASKYPQLEREIYDSAVQKAYVDGDLERARKIASDYQGDPDIKQDLHLLANRAQIWAEKKDEILKNIETTLEGNRDLGDQVSVLLISATQIGAIDQKAGVKLLNRANDTINAMKADKEQTQLQMVLAAAYCAQKSDRGFEVMESLLPRINALVAAAVQLDGYENHYLREGEWNMSAEGGVGELLTNMTHYAEHFAWCDFDRAVEVAGQFERPEIRLMAQLKLAQAILAGQPKRVFPLNHY